MIALGLFFLANFATASSGAIFRSGDWYERLNKPGWTPPNWAFPVVWTTLFAMNAVSGWLVWRELGTVLALPLVVYVISLAFNAGWSALFFGLRRMDLALVEVSGFWLSIAAVAILFWPISPLAALLQLPYLAWVSVATALNLRMVQLNPRAAA